jgi:hypothetical protein
VFFGAKEMEAVMRRRVEALPRPVGMRLKVFVNPSQKEWDAAEASIDMTSFFLWPRASKQVEWNLETVLAEVPALFITAGTPSHVVYPSDCWDALLRVRKQPPAFEGDKDIRCNVTLFIAHLRK